MQLCLANVPFLSSACHGATAEFQELNIDETLHTFQTSDIQITPGLPARVFWMNSNSFQKQEDIMSVSNGFPLSILQHCSTFHGPSWFQDLELTYGSSTRCFESGFQGPWPAAIPRRTSSSPRSSSDLPCAPTNQSSCPGMAGLFPDLAPKSSDVWQMSLSCYFTFSARSQSK